jgi:N-methylhydantoinase B/oxoprolinase/acetone carboxylase alpha subunit
MLQIQDMKVRLSTCLKIKERIEEIAKEYTWDAVAATLRWTLEDTEAEVRRRLRAWPDGAVRSVVFPDSTLRENCLIKICLEARKKGEVLELDFRGTSPQFLNRANNTELQALKGMLAQEFLTFVWPDLPRNQAVFAPMRLITDHGSAVDCTRDAPTAQSMMTFFPAFTALQMVIPKFLYATAKRYTNIHAPWYNMITTFIYGGVNQHGETVGNLCADLNGMSGGARENMDGENSIAPIFAAMTDLGEQELLEEETPIVKIVPHRMLRDNQGFGKHRGGTGYQVIATVRRSDAFGFMTTCVGSKFPSTYGLFGGYGAPTYPLCKVKGMNAFAILAELPEEKWTIPSIMNERPFPGAKYSTHHMGMQFELVKQGEVYMISQGAGGGYGDPLEREPESVMKDLREGLISDWVAQEMYRIVYDERTRSVDVEATAKARADERERRKQRGKPFDEFVQGWTKPEPAQNVPFYGSWNSRDELYLGNPSQKVERGATGAGVMMPDPKDVRIAELEQRLRDLGIDFQE